MAKEKVKPCPFCGSKKVEINRTNQNACWVSCTECGAHVWSDPSRQAAIKFWNRRRGVTGQSTIIYDDER
jgi:Lar family restriction alleviation protein